jgi:hypothetical protein
LSLLAQLLSQIIKNIFHQPQQKAQQNGEELQYSASSTSLLSTVAPQQTQKLIKKFPFLSPPSLFLLPLSSRRLLQQASATSRETHFDRRQGSATHFGRSSFNKLLQPISAGRRSTHFGRSSFNKLLQPSPPSLFSGFCFGSFCSSASSFSVFFPFL